MRAFFCPHCGQQLKASSPSPDSDAILEIPEAELKKLDSEFRAGAQKPVLAVPPSPTTTAAATPSTLNAANAPQSGSDVLDEKSASAAQSVTSATKREAALSAKPPRVTAIARGAISGNLRPRVEKLREVSNVVLDEAADDPSLRFVLIAAALIIVSVVIFLVSLWR